MTNTLLRTTSWFLSLTALFIISNLYWNHHHHQSSTTNDSSSSCSCANPLSSTQDFFILSCLFLHRGFIEVYRKIYTVRSSSSSSPLSFSAGRSSLWVRLVTSLLLVIICFFAVLESANTIFATTTTNSHDEGNSEDNNDHHALPNDHYHHHHHNAEEDEAVKRVYNRHHSMVDADRSSFDTLAKSKRNHENHQNAFTPGSVPAHYHLLLHDEDEEHQKRRQQQQEVSCCSIWSSLVASSVLVWVFYCANVALMFWSVKSSMMTKKRYNNNNKKTEASHDEIDDTRDDDDDNKKETFTINVASTFNQNNDDNVVNSSRNTGISLCWALHFDFANEITLISNLVTLTFLINLLGHYYSVFSASEIPAYHTFVAGVWIIRSEVSNSCLPPLRALSLSLTEREVNIVESLKKAIVRHGEGHHHHHKSDSVILRASKTHLGTLNLEVEVTSDDKRRSQDDQNNQEKDSSSLVNTSKEEIIQVIKTSALWERVFEVESIRVLMS